MQLIDSHCHLDDARFDVDRAEVVERARVAGVERFIVPAVSREGWDKLKTLASKHESILPSFGMHPWFCDRHSDDDLELLPAFLEDAVAVGECGLDAGLCKFGVDEQLSWFRGQLRLAAEFELPVIVHAYKTVDTVIHEMKSYPGLRGVVHSFSGSRQQAERLLDLGFYLGIGGAVTHERATRLQGIVKALPIERLLLETDAPDQPPCARSGMRNEPAFLIEIVDHIATLRGIDAEALVRTCNANTMELFRI
ncbi:TatD DNase family protein [Mariprofundus ferrinatatus]|uniref:TatD DNase family protein n=1 Tax=Mariprofundus ferrinatatus TaxID=1921087 RepID=A0A2K8L1T9_9PROT|nr:TatD family hydrolase [Mariprofundus ferrinatatus]ATX81052.1 TatD DNase family protein [Mariprofundus ferrinatatus]